MLRPLPTFSDSPVARGRREFLMRLLGLVGAVALPWSSVAHATPGARPFDSRESSLSESDLRIATLGRQFKTEEPVRARRLIEWVEAELPPWGRLGTPARRARIVREQLLTSRRLAQDFERGDVVTIDGWVLARTEGAVAVYLNSLVRPGRS
ncbi:MAG: hypothetical protein HRU00_05700 [Myxococcales bacterium]|nr:hypothetical protein [Myxococcales bacterium]